MRCVHAVAAGGSGGQVPATQRVRVIREPQGAQHRISGRPPPLLLAGDYDSGNYLVDMFLGVWQSGAYARSRVDPLVPVVVMHTFCICEYYYISVTTT